MATAFKTKGLFFRVSGKHAERAGVREIPWEEAETLVPSGECEIIKNKVIQNGMHFEIRRKSTGVHEFRTDDTGTSPYRKGKTGSPPSGV
jgi:hypothetical protein